MADGNTVTVFERAERAGGAFRYAGKAPLFQDVVANQEFVRPLYDGSSRRPARRKGVTFRYGVDVARWPELLRPFDRIVIATGAAYRFGLGPVATPCSTAASAAGRWSGRCCPRRRSATGSTTGRGTPTGAALQGLARPGQKVVVIGDALAAGKSRPAISSAFEAALRS